MKTLIAVLALALLVPATASASSKPQETPGGVRVMGGYAILAFPNTPWDVEWSSAVGRVSRCPRNADGKYRCTFRLTWRMRDTGDTGHCWANVLLSRHDWYFPAGRTSCPVDWLP